MPLKNPSNGRPNDMLYTLKVFYSTQKTTIFYIGISLLVYLEAYLLSILLTSPYYDPIMKAHIEIHVLIAKFYGWFWLFLTMLLFMIKRSRLEFRNEISRAYVLFHISFIFIFAYVLYLTGDKSLSILGGVEYIIKLIRPLGITFSELTIKYSIVFLFLLGGLHYTLLLSIFHMEKTYVKYLVAILQAVLCVIIYKVFLRIMYVHGIYAIADVVYLLLKCTGFHTLPMKYAEPFPIIGTDLFKVSIGEPCSGVEGISTFLFAFAMLVLLKWSKVMVKNALLVAFGGVIAMYALNIMRIYVLILIGHFYGSAFAVNLWHSEGSLFLYAIAIIAILGVSNKWMIRKDTE